MGQSCWSPRCQDTAPWELSPGWPTDGPPTPRHRQRGGSCTGTGPGAGRGTVTPRQCLPSAAPRAQASLWWLQRPWQGALQSRWTDPRCSVSIVASGNGAFLPQQQGVEPKPCAPAVLRAEPGASCRQDGVPRGHWPHRATFQHPWEQAGGPDNCHSQSSRRPQVPRGSRQQVQPGPREMGSHGKAGQDFQVFSDARSRHSMGPPAGIRPYCPLRHGDLSRWEGPGLALTNTLRPGPPRACHALAPARGVQGLSSGQLPSA